ncbi:hypothetical protein CCACVL1_15851 [Corchorus capsularis]|uniref:Uncharacterized protein n=1 Tax=Corchorus capsularis TaxID=210143 RepID=A0A1R3I0T0_COCAP|nr:hypothetical protein CCACVL1_15851 [Corchorus capsularis]
MSASLAAFERPRGGASITVFKSGPLFISSKGIGWKSWKKRWFILTRTCLVFFKNDPQRGDEDEVNLSLGGIELNNSGSVVIREDKKLLTVLFPESDGGDFTLKAETSEDLYEWKTALEHALAQAPSDAIQWRDKRTAKSLVVGRPVLLALEDIDGSPSFLEKALRFLEEFGSKAEGILRQCADVEEVDLRVEEYEEGRKTEFGSDEDAHVVGDCVKHVLRELASSPVPASCCTALLEANKIQGKEARMSAMRSAILDKTFFPEPNRRLLQRIVKMMHTISCHAQENRMTPSAVAACMAPLLLRPLLAAGECDFDVNDGDNSAQLLLAAANAANNAQTIITTLVEEYENIFDVNDDENLQRCSNVGSPGTRDDHAQPDDSSSLALDPPQIRNPDTDQLEEQGKGNENPINEVAKGESYGSMGEILSTFWGRSNQVRSMEYSVDSSGEEEVDIQRLEMTKNDLQHRIAKEARGNAILQASLERRKQALHQRRLALEQHFSRLQEVHFTRS